MYFRVRFDATLRSRTTSAVVALSRGVLPSARATYRRCCASLIPLPSVRVVALPSKTSRLPLLASPVATNSGFATPPRAARLSLRAESPPFAISPRFTSPPGNALHSHSRPGSRSPAITSGFPTRLSSTAPIRLLRPGHICLVPLSAPAIPDVAYARALSGCSSFALFRPLFGRDFFWRTKVVPGHFRRRSSFHSANRGQCLRCFRDSSYIRASLMLCDSFALHLLLRPDHICPSCTRAIQSRCGLHARSLQLLFLRSFGPLLLRRPVVRLTSRAPAVYLFLFSTTNPLRFQLPALVLSLPVLFHDSVLLSLRPFSLCLRSLSYLLMLFPLLFCSLLYLYLYLFSLLACLFTCLLRLFLSLVFSLHCAFFSFFLSSLLPLRHPLPLYQRGKTMEREEKSGVCRCKMMCGARSRREMTSGEPK